MKKGHCTLGKKGPSFHFGSYIFKQVCGIFTPLWIPITSRGRSLLVKKLPKKNLDPYFGYFAITLEPETLESQSKAQQARILA